MAKDDYAMEKEFDELIFMADDIEQSLRDEDVSLKAFEQFQTFKKSLEHFGRYMATYQAETIQKKAVARVIRMLEGQEKNWLDCSKDSVYYLGFIQLDGYHFLDEYLHDLTKGNSKPIDKGSVIYYVWELIAIDLGKRARHQTNVLDLLTTEASYNRATMIKPRLLMTENGPAVAE